MPDDVTDPLALSDSESSSSRDGPLAGEVALVTGAGRGIGRAAAMELARAGASVVAADKDITAAEETARRIVGEHNHARAMHLDVTDDDAWARVVEAIAATEGPVSILVNNAGLRSSRTQGDGGLLDVDMSTFDRMVATNLRSAVLGAKLVLPSMLEAGRGAIVMISSAVSMQNIADAGTAYTASKGGLNSLTRAIAVTYGRHGVRCNAIAPGFVVDDEEPDVSPSALVDGAAELVGRPGTPADVGHAVVFLASKASDYVNGQVLVLDGGLTVTLAVPRPPLD